MKIKITFQIILFVLGLTQIDTAFSAVESSNVSFEPDHTRVVIESNTQIRFSLFSLRIPDRTILDIEGIESQNSLDALVNEIGGHHPYILPIKISKLKDHQFRIEFPLKVDAEPRVSVLKPTGTSGYMLVMDIYPDLPLPRTASLLPVQNKALKTDKLADKKSISKAPTIQKPVNATLIKAPEFPNALEEMWLAVKINTENSARNALILKRTDGRLLVSKTDLINWRLRLPEMTSIKHDDEDYYPLDLYRGLSYELDSTTQTLLVETSPSLYDATTIQGVARGFIKPSISSLGSFLNYDIAIDQVHGQTNGNGLLEVGVFGSAGVGVSRFLGKTQNKNVSTSGESIIRLDSTFTKDLPDQIASLRIGDIINRPGSWGRSVRLGGVQWGTNFSTQPTFISFPLPGLSGEAVLPSTVDLFVNDSLRLSKQLPTGPFSIQDLPVVTGMGEARLVTTDILGRERVIVQPYYVSPRLLQKGLHDYSYEIGLIRQNFGLKSNDYGQLVAIGTHRLGITDRFTGELHTEFLTDQQALGLSSAWLMPRLGMFSSSVAASNNKNQSGGLLSVGFERQSRYGGFGINTQFTTKEFSQTGFQSTQKPPKQLSQAFASWPLGKGSFGVSYILQDYRDKPRVELINAGYSANFFGLGFLGVSALHFLSGDKATVLGLNFTHVIADRTTASANISSQANNAVGTLQIQQSLPVGTGFGYQLSTGFADSDRRTAGIFAQNDIGTYALEAAQSRGENAFRASANGGVAMINGGAYFTRRVDDSFALVDVSSFPGVRVYADNQVVATTNSKGYALIPRMRPYQKNSIRIEQADIPMNAQIESVDSEVIPYFRSGVIAKFPVRRQQQGTIKVVSENAKPIPVGALAYSTSKDQEFPVGMGGEVYLTDMSNNNHIKITWDKYKCEIDVPFTISSDPLPFLGTYTCMGIKL